MGRVVDPETSLIYLRNRYYDPGTAQFLTRDPLDALTRSVYGYTAGNPFNGTDPSGLDWGCIGSYCLSDGLKGAANFAAGAADFVTSTLTLGSVRVRAPYCGPGLGASYGIGQATGAIEAAVGLSGNSSSDSQATPLSFSDKITGQLESRGWTAQTVEETVATPAETHSVWDYTTGSQQPATAYVRPGGSYVVVNDSTGQVVQISDANNPNWKPVWNDPRFQR